MRAKWIVTVVGIVVSLQGALAAMDVPIPVAPGEANGIAAVRGSCPTFHWSEVDGARAYDLALFRVGADGEAADEIYRVELPGGAQGWTPNVERCLEAGGRYAWALRALGPGAEVGPWSRAKLFEIASAPSVTEVEEALVVLRRWVEAGSDTIDKASAPRAPDEAPGALASPPSGAELHQRLRARPTATRSPAPATSPALEIASLTIDQQLHLGSASHVFKEGALFLWEDSATGITSLGLGALSSNTTGSGNTASGHEALAGNLDGNHNTAFGTQTMQLNTTGSNNTATGWLALTENTTGTFNTATGAMAMHKNSTGVNNTAVGFEALGSNEAGGNNTAVGMLAMHDSLTGSDNISVGARTLRVNTSGSSNVAVGLEALIASTTGGRNTAVGPRAGHNSTIGDDNIFIGSGAEGVAEEGNTIRIGGSTVGTGVGEQNRTFINGITGVNVSGAAVIVGTDGQLGVTVSSQLYKEDIRDLDDTSRRLLALRPVTFRFKDELTEGPKPLEFGLIAEEVAETFPELVVYDTHGRPQTVKYHLLSTLLLNELQELERTSRALGEQVRTLQEKNQEQDLELRVLHAAVDDSADGDVQRLGLSD